MMIETEERSALRPVNPLPGVDRQSLGGTVIRFAHFLKARGFRVFQSDVHHALRALEAISIEKKDAFYYALRATLVSTDMEWIQFDALFHQFWDRAHEQTSEQETPEGTGEAEEKTPQTSTAESPRTLEIEKAVKTEETDQREWLEGVAYSPVSSVEKKAFPDLRNEDIQVAQLALKKLIHPFRASATRRFQSSHGTADIDFRRTLSASRKTMGIPFELFYKRKKKRLKRLVIIADVSGSMDRYARFVMPFLLGIRGVGARTEVFVFSTSICRITPIVRHLDVDKALERIPSEVPEWSGGTRIGYSLMQFNRGEGFRFLNSRSVVVLLSDGWDLGGKAILKREMAHLSGKVHAVVWLNPLAADPDAHSLSQGMNAVRPFVDYILPADSLESLKKVGRLLSRLMIH
ncbi:MAG: VWA domain-containing protein [Deltaproteobacteria bacterium]|nr:VWA domain-containing protein [Deltaproteobacteria bacterium]